MPVQTTMPFFKAPPEALRELRDDPMVWDRIMRRMKVPLGEQTKRLGKGGHGTAIKVGDKVLKLTDDVVETNAAFILQKNPMPEAYHVYDAFKIAFDNTGDKDPWTRDFTRYGIVAELLEQPDGAASKYYRVVVSSFSSFSSGYEALSPESVDECFTRSAGSAVPWSPEEKQAIQWLRRAAANLVKRKIFYTDMQVGNLMKRSNGEHVLIDFGHYSKVPNKRLPVAQLMEQLADQLEG